jgi:hypothetical protein
MDYTHRLELLWDAHSQIGSATRALDSLECVEAEGRRSTDALDLDELRSQLRIAMTQTEEMVRDIAAFAS